MTRPRCEIEGAVVVLVGNFNPRIFHPTWFATNNLLREEEAQVAISSNSLQECLLTPELTVFNAGWLSVQVTPERFVAQTTDPASYTALRDLILGVFGLLEHTPITQMGLNWQMHYKMPSSEDWNEFGHFLVPKAPWDGLLSKPGLRTLTLMGAAREEPGVSTNIRIEPSSSLKPGIFFEANEHYAPVGPNVTNQLMSVLEEAWQSAQNRAKNVPVHLFDVFYASRS